MLCKSSGKGFSIFIFVTGESTNIQKKFASHLPREEDILQRKLKSGPTDKSLKAGRSPRAFGKEVTKESESFSRKASLYFYKF